MSDLTTIRNIGPAQEKALMGVGITSAAQLRELGADKAYTRLLKSGNRPHSSCTTSCTWRYRDGHGTTAKVKKNKNLGYVSTK